MKDEHLFSAVQRALVRYGSSELPEDPTADVPRPARRPRAGLRRRRRSGWVSVREIEASQSPNTYPRLKRRDIRARCKQLAAEEGGRVLEVRTAGLRTWVRFAHLPPGEPDATSRAGAGSFGGVGEGGTVEVTELLEPERKGEAGDGDGGGDGEQRTEADQGGEQPGGDRGETGER